MLPQAEPAELAEQNGTTVAGPPAKTAADFPGGDNNNNNIELVTVVDSADEDEEVLLRQDPDGAVVPTASGTPAGSRAALLSAASTDDEYEYMAVACCDCGDLFPTLNELLLHRVDTHPGRRSHQCPACMATFHRADQLDLHKRSHTPHTPHACPHCGRRFTLRKHVSAHARALHAAAFYGLQQHQGTLAPEERQEFRCRVCSNRVFHTASGLSNHMRCHSDERPFACGVCRETFRYRSSMVRHVKKKHPTAMEN